MTRPAHKNRYKVTAISHHPGFILDPPPFRPGSGSLVESNFPRIHSRSPELLSPRPGAAGSPLSTARGSHNPAGPEAIGRGGDSGEGRRDRGTQGRGAHQLPHLVESGHSPGETSRNGGLRPDPNARPGRLRREDPLGVTGGARGVPGDPQPLMGGAASAEPRLGRGQNRRGWELARDCPEFSRAPGVLPRACSPGPFEAKKPPRGGRG